MPAVVHQPSSTPYPNPLSPAKPPTGFVEVLRDLRRLAAPRLADDNGRRVLLHQVQDLVSVCMHRQQSPLLRERPRLVPVVDGKGHSHNNLNNKSPRHRLLHTGTHTNDCNGNPSKPGSLASRRWPHIRIVPGCWRLCLGAPVHAIRQPKPRRLGRLGAAIARHLSVVKRRWRC